MKSSNKPDPIDQSAADLQHWMDKLQIQLGVAAELMETYLLRDDKYYVDLATTTETLRHDNSPEEIRQENRRVVLRQLIAAFRPLKKVLLHLEPDMNTSALDRLVDELWDIERGGRNWLLKRPEGLGRGNRPSAATSVHRVPIVLAYDRLIKDGSDKGAALASLAEQTSLPISTISAMVDDFHESAKDRDSMQFYKRLSDLDATASELVILYKQFIEDQRG